MDDIMDAFSRFVDVQRSGVVNMFDSPRVRELADITINEYVYILRNYAELNNKYRKVTNLYNIEVKPLIFKPHERIKDYYTADIEISDLIVVQVRVRRFNDVADNSWRVRFYSYTDFSGFFIETRHGSSQDWQFGFDSFSSAVEWAQHHYANCMKKIIQEALAGFHEYANIIEIGSEEVK